MDDNRAGPQFVGAGARRIDCRGAIHPRRLRGIRIQFIGVHDPHAMEAVVGFVGGHHKPPLGGDSI